MSGNATPTMWADSTSSLPPHHEITKRHIEGSYMQLQSSDHLHARVPDALLCPVVVVRILGAKPEELRGPLLTSTHFSPS